MIDWWTVRGEQFGVNNLDFKVELTPDKATRLRDFEYNEAEAEAFDRDAWQYVNVDVTPVDLTLTDLPHYKSGVAGVQWGEVGEDRVDRENVTEESVYDVVQEILAEMEAAGFEVEHVEENVATS